MSMPMIAVTNASTCLTDSQVEAVLPAIQKQVTDDFRAYWDLDRTLIFLSSSQPLARGWWQIALLDNPDQSGVLGYHEMSSQGTPLGKVFAKLDISNGTSWTVTLSHELLEMLADPWTNWCAVGSDGRSMHWKMPTRWRRMRWVMKLTPCWFRTSSLQPGSSRRGPT